MYPRFVEQQIKEALGDTRVVLLTNFAGTSAGVANSAGVGPRQVIDIADKIF
jgi:hypothetical protein